MSTEPDAERLSDESVESVEGVDDGMAAVDRVELPERVTELAAEYDRVCGDRDTFLWRWIYSLLPEFTLSTVPDVHAEQVRTHKTVLTMYVTMLDDVLERHGDRETFEEACKLRRPHHEADLEKPGVDAEFCRLLDRVWSEFVDGITTAPRRKEFQDILEYDLKQTTNAIDYSEVLNRHPRMANLSGTRRYGAHNMVMFAYSDVDLMYSTGFELGDFGELRDLLWDLQELARVGNWLTTWERELGEGDYTAGIVVEAIEDDVVTVEELRTEDPAAIAERVRAAGIEERFRDRWERRYREVSSRSFDAESIDLAALVAGMETVMAYHTASRGRK